MPSRWLLRLDTVLAAAGLTLAPHPVAGLHALLDKAGRNPGGRSARAAGPPVALRTAPAAGDRDRDLDARSLRHLCPAYPEAGAARSRWMPIPASPSAACSSTRRWTASSRAGRMPCRRMPSTSCWRSAAPPSAKPWPGPASGPSGGRVSSASPAWFVEIEANRRALLQRSWTERSGRMLLPGPAGAFELTPRPTASICSKMPALPSSTTRPAACPRKTKSGSASRPSFRSKQRWRPRAVSTTCRRHPVAALNFWRLDGGDPAGEIVAVADDPAEIAAAGARRTDPAHRPLRRPRHPLPRPPPPRPRPALRCLWPPGPAAGMGYGERGMTTLHLISLSAPLGWGAGRRQIQRHNPPHPKSFSPLKGGEGL